MSFSVETAFQLAFLMLKRHRKCVGIGVTAALIGMAIGRCWYVVSVPVSLYYSVDVTYQLSYVE